MADTSVVESSTKIKSEDAFIGAGSSAFSIPSVVSAVPAVPAAVSIGTRKRKSDSLNESPSVTISKSSRVVDSVMKAASCAKSSVNIAIGTTACAVAAVANVASVVAAAIATAATVVADSVETAKSEVSTVYSVSSVSSNSAAVPKVAAIDPDLSAAMNAFYDAPVAVPSAPGWTYCRNTQFTFPAGKYYIGDLCYVLPDSIYENVFGGYEYANGLYRNNNAGSTQIFMIGGTSDGDGKYDGSDGNSFCVDAGIIGICPVSMIAKEKESSAKRCGHIYNFDTQVRATFSRGVFVFTSTHSRLVIDTCGVIESDGSDSDV